MSKKRILLTGDDGYNAIGIRLLIHFLKDKFALNIAATKTQQSGVGGKLSVFAGGSWGQTKVDGVQALWVSGTPGDAIECARSFYRQKFDLVISGINMGLNISDGFTSGTIAAAWRSIKLNLADQAMAVSWDAPVKLYNRSHKGEEKLSRFLSHPGKTALKVINLAIKNRFWQSPFLNVNLPRKTTNQLKFTQLLPHISDYYPDVTLYRGKAKHYAFPQVGSVKPDFKSPEVYDAWVVNHGYVSLTPFSPNLLDFSSYRDHAGPTLDLDTA